MNDVTALVSVRENWLFFGGIVILGLLLTLLYQLLLPRFVIDPACEEYGNLRQADFQQYEWPIWTRQARYFHEDRMAWDPMLNEWRPTIQPSFERNRSRLTDGFCLYAGAGGRTIAVPLDEVMPFPLTLYTIGLRFEVLFPMLVIGMSSVVGTLLYSRLH